MSTFAFNTDEEGNITEAAFFAQGGPWDASAAGWPKEVAKRAEVILSALAEKTTCFVTGDKEAAKTFVTMCKNEGVHPSITHSENQINVEGIPAAICCH